MNDPFNRKIGFVCVGLVKGRVKNGLRLLEEIELTLNNSVIPDNHFLGLPFTWLMPAFRYGTKNNLSVEFQRISKTKYLPIALELDMEILKWADQNNMDLLYDIFMIASLEALIQVGKKYKFPLEPYLELRSQYEEIPNTIEECTSYQSKSKTL
jgi:hypothetical protein